MKKNTNEVMKREVDAEREGVKKNTWVRKKELIFRAIWRGDVSRKSKMGRGKNKGPSQNQAEKLCKS